MNRLSEINNIKIKNLVSANQSASGAGAGDERATRVAGADAHAADAAGAQHAVQDQVGAPRQPAVCIWYHMQCHLPFVHRLRYHQIWKLSILH